MKKEITLLADVLEEFNLKQQERWNELAKHINGGWLIINDRWNTIITKKKKNRRKMKKHGKTI